MAPPAAARVRCPAKINLGLWILGERPDGYHEIDTIVQAVALEDDLVVTRGGDGLSLEVAGLPIPGPGTNIVERAFDLLRNEAGSRATGLKVQLTKRIPVGGGLGGGSSDAAGFLAAASAIWGLGLGAEDLESLGARLGSDVPFFVRGGTARATGRGERVRHLCPLPPAWIVLATPPVAVSTTWAYGRAKIALTLQGGSASMLAVAIERRDWLAIASHLHNDFEDVVLPEFGVVARLRRVLEESGVLGSLLSGSGSTVFGLARTQEEAQLAARRVAALGAAVHVVRTTERGVALAELR